MSHPSVRVGIILAVLAAIAGAAWMLGRRGPSLAEAEARLSAGDVDEARRVAERILAAAPDNRDAWQFLGELLEREGKFSSAANAFERVAMKSAPEESWEPRFRQSMALYRAGNLEAAEGMLKNLLAERPDDERVQTELQWLLFNQLREREVEQHLEALLKHDPGSHRLLLHLLRSSQRRPIAQEAVTLLEQANAAIPGQASVELALGRCYWKLGDVSRARTFILRARNRGPRDLETELLVAEFFLEQGNPEEAESALTLPKGPEAERWTSDDRWWWLMGQRAMQEKNWAQALRHIDAASDRRPGELRYVNARAVILQALNRREESAVAHQRARELAEANRKLYILDSNGDVDQPSRKTCLEVSRLYQILKRPIPAGGWAVLAESLDD